MPEQPRRQVPLRIGINGRILVNYEMRGLARYTVELFRAMKEIMGDRIELYSFSPEPIAPEFLELLRMTPVIFSSSREILWEQVALPRELRRMCIDIFHATAERGLPLYPGACKYVLTRHDIIDRLPEYCAGDSVRARWRKRYADFVSVHRADRFITVSSFSKQDICRYYGLSADRVVVIHNAAHPRFYERVPPERAVAIRRGLGIGDGYLLFLGGFDIKKNVSTLVEAYAQLAENRPPLVLAGKHSWEYQAISDRIRRLGLSRRIFCPGELPDEDLPAVYQGALAFVHPSTYEGFGLQIVEAMASGIPVLASQNTSLPEVLDGCGLLFNPRDALSIADCMERILHDRRLRAELAEKGRLRARFFSWCTAAEETLRIYFEVLGMAGEFRAGNEAKSASHGVCLK